ncbi:MAG: DUF4118 domain-containing protein, partial [Acidimicrobiales bacterium]
MAQIIGPQAGDLRREARALSGDAGSWAAPACVLVAIPSSPSGADLIRRAAVLATAAGGELLGVHVRQVANGRHHASPGSPEEGRREALSAASSGSTALLDAHRLLLTELGGTYREVVGRDVVRSLVQLARAESAGQIVVGAGAHPRSLHMPAGSVAGRLLREVATTKDARFDVQVVSRRHAPPPTARGAASSLPAWPSAWRPIARISRRRRMAAFALASFALPLLTVLLTAIRSQVGFSGALPSYLLVVTAVATLGGIVAAIPVVVAAFLLLNWYFVAPLHTFSIADVRSVSALVAYVVVAGVVSVLVGVAARRAADARRARSEAEALATMAGSLLRGEDALTDLVAVLGSTFRAESVALLRAVGHTWSVEAAYGSKTTASPSSPSLELNLGAEVRLVVVAKDLTAEDRAVLNAFAAQLALALESRRLSEEAARAAALVKANELRGA